MLRLDLPIVSLEQTPTEAFKTLRRTGRSAVLAGSAGDFRVIRADDLFRAIHQGRRRISELPYHPVTHAETEAGQDFYFMLHEISASVAHVTSRSERLGGPLLAGPADCYCVQYAHPAPGAKDDDKCRICGSKIVCLRF